MTSTIRFIAQAILWIFIWLFLSLELEETYKFLMGHIIVYIFQVILIAFIIFYLAKKFLFTKKYFLFFSISIVIIGSFAFTSSQISEKPRLYPPLEHRSKPPRPNSLGPEKRDRKNSISIINNAPPPSLFSVHLSHLTICFLITTFIETFLLAQKKEEEIIKSKNQNLQTELKLLKSQINPHFLFNSLNNIYALSVIDSDKTQKSISYLSDMLRYVLYECQQPFVPIQKEITYIQNYIKLFSLKSSKPFPITTKFSVANDYITIAPMLFISFIENAFKHSNIEKFNGSFILISIDANTENLMLKVKNSIPKENLHKDKIGGIGLENVKKRLDILYPERYQLLIDDQKTDIFKVILTIKLNNNA